MRSEPQAADLCLLIIPCALKTLEFCADHSIVAGMLTILSAIVSLVCFRFRRRASLELEVLALRHQVAVLHRQRPGRVASSERPPAVGLALPSLAALPEGDGAGQAGDRDPVAPAGLPQILALAITIATRRTAGRESRDS